MYPRTLKLEVEKAEERGYRATVYLGSIQSNVGLLGTRPPVEKERRVKFGKCGDEPCMNMKMGHRDWVFFRKDEKLYGKIATAEEGTCSLSRPKE